MRRCSPGRCGTDTDGNRARTRAALLYTQTSRRPHPAVALDSNFPEQALWAVDYEAALRCELDRPDGLGVLAQTAARLAENRDTGATISSRTAIVAALAGERQWQTVLETAVDTVNLIRECQVLGVFESFFLKHISTAQFELGDLAAARAAAAEGVAQIRSWEGCWSPNSYAALPRPTGSA